MIRVIALSVDVTCCVCFSDDDTDTILGHFIQCIWCQRFLHENCITQFQQVLIIFNQLL